jgi:hypothetical protein
MRSVAEPTYMFVRRTWGTENCGISLFTVFLDRASVRGLASLPPQSGIRGFGRPTSQRALHH